MNSIQAIIKDSPWEVIKWADHIGLHNGLACDTIIRAIEIDEAQYGGSGEIELLAYKARELQSLAVIYPGEKLKPTLRRAEAVIQAGLDTTLGYAIASSPFRWNCTVQSILATQTRKVIP